MDERERQRARRARLAAIASGRASCHEPASPPKSAEWADKMLESWDSAVALSRASLQRRLRAISRSSLASAETAQHARGTMSRATLGP